MKLILDAALEYWAHLCTYLDPRKDLCQVEYLSSMHVFDRNEEQLDNSCIHI